MGTTYTDKIVMSIGGSLIVPNGGIDTTFLKKLNEFIRQELASHPDRQFFLIIGGGGTARHYRDAGKESVKDITEEDLDWLGIHSTRLNAHLVRTIFHDIAHPHIIEHYEIIRKAIEPVVVASGWKPGWSTDFCSVMICEDYDVHTVLNLSNIEKVYTADPNKDPNAQPIDSMTWNEFRELVGDEWHPGMNAPFDPIAAKKAQELGVKVIVLNGKNLDNVKKAIEGKPFTGTTIQ